MSPRPTCPVLPPDYSTTRSVGPWDRLPRYGSSDERSALHPATLWTLAFLEGSGVNAHYAGEPQDRQVTIKNSTTAKTAAGEC